MTLREYLFFKRISINAFAKSMDYSRTHMSAIVWKKANASRKLADKIEKFTEGEIKAEDLRKQVPRSSHKHLNQNKNENKENFVE